MSQKSKINLSYDRTEYYIISMAYSIGQLIYFVCILELHSYFTLQLAETADTVYDSSTSLCVAHKWWRKLGNFYFPFLSENLCYRKRLYICLVNHNYFVSSFRLERQNTNYAYSKYPKSKSSLISRKELTLSNKPFDTEWKWKLEIPANCDPWVCIFTYHAKKLPVNKTLLILIDICWLLRKEVGFKISGKIENTFL